MYQIQYISSALRPDVAGINPILLDVRVIHDTINIIRELSQVVILDDILLALGLSKQRMQQFVAGDSLNDDEISNNIAFLTFLSTQSIQNIFGNKARLLNEAFCDICLVQMVLPIPVEIFKPKDPNIKIPYTIGEKIQRRAESDQTGMTEMKHLQCCSVVSTPRIDIFDIIQVTNDIDTDSFLGNFAGVKQTVEKLQELNISEVLYYFTEVYSVCITTQTWRRLIDVIIQAVDLKLDYEQNRTKYVDRDFTDEYEGNIQNIPHILQDLQLNEQFSDKRQSNEQNIPKTELHKPAFSSSHVKNDFRILNQYHIKIRDYRTSTEQHEAVDFDDESNNTTPITQNIIDGQNDILDTSSSSIQQKICYNNQMPQIFPLISTQQLCERSSNVELSPSSEVENTSKQSNSSYSTDQQSLLSWKTVQSLIRMAMLLL
ncbi:MAG: hypothetical protein EZS28_004696 [Streblomastix strix]|uniref:Uncharacterized protein n=1 Tax=Streblomastix strix TaxID=222440 RepID=A0A5J4WXG3_9EUKA|nr:MAG: hypothetical protein EZS28_004696 [Streblomastix strix]